MGQFAAESWLLARFRDSAAGESLLSSFHGGYISGGHKTSTSEVAVYLGSHVTVFSPHTGWSDEEGTEKAVLENLDLIHDAWDAWQTGKEVALYAQL